MTRIERKTRRDSCFRGESKEMKVKYGELPATRFDLVLLSNIRQCIVSCSIGGYVQ